MGTPRFIAVCEDGEDDAPQRRAWRLQKATGEVTPEIQAVEVYTGFRGGIFYPTQPTPGLPWVEIKDAGGPFLYCTVHNSPHHNPDEITKIGPIASVFVEDPAHAPGSLITKLVRIPTGMDMVPTPQVARQTPEEDEAGASFVETVLKAFEEMRRTGTTSTTEAGIDLGKDYGALANQAYAFPGGYMRHIRGEDSRIVMPYEPPRVRPGRPLGIPPGTRNTCKDFH